MANFQSKSIADLLSMVGSANNQNPQAPEGQLQNPDIPTLKQKAAASIQASKDTYYSAMKMPTLPRNGGYFSLGRGKVDDNPRVDSFMLEGAIDPNTIRRKADPLHSTPNLYAFGSQGAEYAVPESAMRSNNNVNLLVTARKSFANYKNRFELPTNAPQQ